MTSREDIMKAMDALQVERCAYVCFTDGKPRKPIFCDCKFGLSEAGKRDRGEQNGCPELRTVSHILSKMSDEEFQEICNRK